jgi:hypothetical protein
MNKYDMIIILYEIKDLEIENEKNKNRKFYKKLEILTKTHKPRKRKIGEKGTLNRWNEHFKGEQSTRPF